MLIWFKKQFRDHPLRSIIVLAFFVRLIAVFFAKGYMMHDDHFLTIEPSGSWAAGKNFNDWMPGIGNNNPHPEPISFFYLGFLFVFFKIFYFFGIDNPDTQMYIIRFLQACYSLLIVYYGYKITEILSNKKNAAQVGILLALIAILPNFSVRNLVEMVCIPPLMIGFYHLLRGVRLKNSRIGGVEFSSPVNAEMPNRSSEIKGLMIAAILMGLAVGVRFQTGLLVALVGLVLLFQSNFKNAFIFGVVSFAAFFVTQLDDVLLWGGEPFQHLKGYFEYNKLHANDYPGSPFAYLSFIGIFILPPVSLFLLFGFFRSWKKYLLIFLPILGFLLFHILYPNKQERFILPALPFVVMLGVIGWNEFVTSSAFWQNRKSLLRGCWVFFWSLNTLAMLVLCFTYAKKNRVESMLYLYEQNDCRNFALEFSHSEGGSMMPQFYSGEWTNYYTWNRDAKPEEDMLNFKHNEEVTSNDLQPRLEPNYFLFYEGDRLDERIAAVKKYYPSLTYNATIYAGWFDEVLHSLNPKNTLETIQVYKVEGQQ